MSLFDAPKLSIQKKDKMYWGAGHLSPSPTNTLGFNTGREKHSGHVYKIHVKNSLER